MKKFTQILIITIISCSSVFAIGGFGIQAGQSMFNIDASTQYSDDTQLVSLSNGVIDGAYVFGGYLYIDAIPFIDIEIDGNISGNTYDINFSNVTGSMDQLTFGLSLIHI